MDAISSSVIFAGLTGADSVHESVRTLHCTRRVVKAIVCHQCAFVMQSVQRLVRVPRLRLAGTPPCRVGFLGCGEMGQAILEALLAGGLAPESASVMTRTCVGLERFEEAGVVCTTDPAEVARTCDVVVLACPPAQLQAVAAKVRGAFKQSALLLSLLAGVGEPKLRQLFEVPAVVRTATNAAELEGWADAVSGPAGVGARESLALVPVAAHQFASAATAGALATALAHHGAAHGAQQQDLLDAVRACLCGSDDGGGGGGGGAGGDVAQAIAEEFTSRFKPLRENVEEALRA
jgi:hypothetical protein